MAAGVLEPAGKKQDLQSDWYILFYSKSACPTARHLSNFARSPVPFTYRGREFDTIEAAFQAAKYLYSDRPELFGEVAGLPPAEAKSAGSKSGMLKRGARLDLGRWNGSSVGVMKELVRARMAVDERYRETILAARGSGTALLHFEARGKAPVWGGRFPAGEERTPGNFRGGNLLGKILSGEL